MTDAEDRYGGCDPCGAKGVEVRFCFDCGIDYCDECTDAHEVMHEMVQPEVERAKRWVAGEW
jgi:hypothetical protein